MGDDDEITVSGDLFVASPVYGSFVEIPGGVQFHSSGGDVLTVEEIVELRAQVKHLQELVEKLTGMDLDRLERLLRDKERRGL
jgi:hypothetical protein